MMREQTGGYIYQVVSFQKKNRPEKCPFAATNDWTVSAVQWSVKYFFQIPQYSGKVRQKKEKLAITKRYVLQANTINQDFQC